MRFDPHCRRCRLSSSRTQVVPPEGDMNSPICFLGEAPGEKEDKTGRPFVGRAGKMLDRIMEEVGLSRKEVLITNVVKCRPPNNRRPKKDEMSACLPFLMEELVGKKVIIAMGRTACLNLLGRDVKLEEEANRILQVAIGNTMSLVIPTYHPAACLYSARAREALRRSVEIAKEYLPEMVNDED
ncbi:MAG: uracil-DNA glycosylase [Methanomassiliicoccales archaeon]|nr:uracil-DNA glycosylase [Methanomassiliicoccales archaeon]